MNILKQHRLDEGAPAWTRQARASALRAGIAWRAEELARLVEEGAPRHQIDAVARTLADLQTRLHIHEIGLRETDPRNET